MPDRLAELRRQRALVAEHLAWIDQEIASQSPSTAAIPLHATAAIETGVAAGSISPQDPKRMVMLGGKLVAIRTEPEHHEHPPLPEHNPANIHQAVRHGCFFYVVLAALLLVTGGALLVWASQEYKKKHPPAPFQAAPEKL